MAQDRHPYLCRLGPVIDAGQLTGRRAGELAGYAASALDEEAGLVECRRTDGGIETVIVRLQLHPPQRPVADIRQSEEIAVVFTASDQHPALLALRPDFPDTPHQNMMPEGLPRYPCVDDRPWDEAAPGWTAYAYLERIKWWLNSAAVGELTGTGQVVDPFFVVPGPELIVPIDVLLSNGSGRTFIFMAPDGVREENVRCLNLVEVGSSGQSGLIRFRALFLTAPAVAARSITTPPRNLASLVRLSVSQGFDLIGELQKWALETPSAELTLRPALLLNSPVHRPGTDEVRQDAVAFSLLCSLGRLGTMLGALSPDPDSTTSWGRLLKPLPVDPALLATEPLFPMAVQPRFEAGLARPLSGVTAGSTSRVLLIGAGAIGSHMAVMLTREGRHTWTVADGDWLRPHNLARHVLGQRSVGHLKAPALATLLSELGGTPAQPIVCDVLRPGEQEEALHKAAEDADVIMDASASVGVARRISDWDIGRSRRLSAFFNPAGTSAVLLVESTSRSSRLDELEALYYRLVLRDDTLADHLTPPTGGFRYAGSCRAVSARIPESRVAVLSGLICSGISAALDSELPRVGVWSLRPDGSVTVTGIRPPEVRREAILDWTILLDHDLATEIAARRRAALPRETGGVLVGVVDHQRRVIALVDALPPPPDSRGSARGFTRGTEGLAERLRDISARTAGMVRYVGEWHTHPRHSTSLPSSVDLEQLLSLRQELRREGLPATMLIGGADGERMVLLTDASGQEGSA